MYGQKKAYLDKAGRGASSVRFPLQLNRYPSELVDFLRLLLVEPEDLGMQVRLVYICLCSLQQPNRISLYILGYFRLPFVFWPLTNSVLLLLSDPILSHLTVTPFGLCLSAAH
jgi:hypothetical protein